MGTDGFAAIDGDQGMLDPTLPTGTDPMAAMPGMAP
jgi:hypothetical protein